MTADHRIGDALPVATRAWTRRVDEEQHDQTPRRVSWQRREPVKWRQSVLIFDTETTTDTTQRLTFGCYRFGTWRDDGTLAIAEEGFFHADDLPDDDPAGFDVLSGYVASHAPDTSGLLRGRSLRLRSLSSFLDDVLWPCLRQDALIVGFNLPFDLSRIACRAAAARGKHQGGFSFVLWRWRNPDTGKLRDNQFRPRIRVTQIDSKRARIDITQPKGRPTGWNGKPVIYAPGFLDLRTLAFALTDRGYSLRSACDDFGVDDGKSDPGGHGVITPGYVAYARQDVKATGKLLEALRAEYDRHPIDLDPCRAFSPASIAKAYYRAMGIAPRLTTQPDFPPDILGYAMSAYYGGRAECAIRRTPVPIVYTDTLSMYPTVNANLGLWRFHTAARVAAKDWTADAQRFLDGLTMETLLKPATWPRLCFFGQVVPDGDIVPVRARYSKKSATFNIGVNPFTDVQPHWYAGPDIAASIILTGKVPTLLRAVRLVPVGTSRHLTPVALRGTVPVDPASGDFFRSVIEERKRAKARADLSPQERTRLDKFLKVLANSGSYGVFVESNPEELRAGETVPVNVYGPDETPFVSETTRPETPGVFSFPPVASVLTAGARLVLALIERLVRDAGGSYAFCDTDSMAIVATATGGLVPCPGGDVQMPDGRAAITALSWADVECIAATLDTLNPYDRDAVPGSILKIEDVNYDPDTGERRHVWCLSIAAKRYALFTVSDDGEPAILPGTTRHGLGYLIDPRSSDDGDAGLLPWEHTLWDGIVRERLGLPATPPPWQDRPAVGRHTISSPQLLDAFATVNRRKPYAQQIKPFNFMISVSLEAGGRPDGIEPDERFSLVTVYESNPRRWPLRNWFDRYTGTSYRITTDFPGGGKGIAGVKSLGSVARAYPYHIEAKRLGPDGMPCRSRTEGQLQRRPVIAAGLVCVGKEAHKLDERELVSELEELHDVFTDQRRGPWTMHVLPKLRDMVAEPGGLDALAGTVGMTPRRLRDAVTGKSRPKKEMRGKLAALVEASGDCERAASSRVCAACGEPLKTSEPRRRYCSTRCRKKHEKRRRRQAPPILATAAD